VAACNNKKNNNAGDNPPAIITPDENAALQERWTWPDSIEDILIVPDELLMQGDSILSPMDVYTPEQKKFVKLLMGTYIDNVEVRNDSLFLTISHEDFVNKGIPEPYYDQILHDIRGLNSLKKDGFDFGGKTMAGWWEQEREKLREELFAD